VLQPDVRQVWGHEHFQRLGFGQAIPVLEKRERAFFETLEP
jgi:hypothetical protein